MTEQIHLTPATIHQDYVLEMGRNRLTGPGKELLNDPKVIDLYMGAASRST